MVFSGVGAERVLVVGDFGVHVSLASLFFLEDPGGCGGEEVLDGGKREACGGWGGMGCRGGEVEG